MNNITHLKELIPFSEKLNILFVDDDSELRTQMIKILENFFGLIHTAQDGEDALKKYVSFYESNQKFYDLIISDLNMPKMNGVDLCAELTTLNSLQSIIVISAYSESYKLTHLINLGICKFIHKPIDKDELFHNLTIVINNLKINYDNVNYTKKVVLKNKELEKEIELINDEKKILKQLALKDKLTNLYNRHYIDEYLITEFISFKRYNTSLCIILLDLDNLKYINDNCGHNAGDKLLMDISNILQKSVRHSDVIGRWGGDEFIIIAKETNLKNAIILSNHLKETISKNEFNQKCVITARFGVAEFCQNNTIEETIDKADKALYIAKNRGRNRVDHLK